MARGALGTDPKFKLATDLEGLLAQRKDPKNAAYRSQISKAIAAARKGSAAPTPETGGGLNAPNYDQTYNQAIGATGNLFNQIGAQQPFQPPAQVPQFNPGDYQQQFDKAYQTSMNQFNRSMEPTFQKQNQDWQQMAAERGWDITNKDIGNAFKMQVADPQNSARQQAMDSAFNAGLGAQAQAYNQSANTYGQQLAGQGQQFNQNYSAYQMPYQNLGAIAPFFSQGSNQAFLGNQAALDRQQQEYMAGLQNQYQLQQIRAVPRGGGGGGGGGLSLQDQLALQNNAFYNNMVLAAQQGYGQQPQGGGAGNGFAQGINAGAGAFLGSMLRP